MQPRSKRSPWSIVFSAVSSGLPSGGDHSLSKLRMPVRIECSGGASWIATATPRAKRRSDFGKIRVKCQCEGRLLVGSSVGLLHAASFDICRSANRKNRVLRAPATTDSCDIGADDPEGRLLERISQRDRVLCLQRLNLVGAHQGSCRQALNLGLLFLANVPYASTSVQWFGSPLVTTFGVLIARPIEQQSRSSSDENHGCNRIVRFCSQDG